ncbi:MAG: hypothetical protein NXI09_02310 [Bacteroidetes bacterium]|nr:hypothetical protein [Bacteroidota bacterium]
MNKKLQHIEDFVRAKLGLVEGASQPDWLDFERKLRKATRIRQMKRAAGMVGVLLLLGLSQTLISGDWPLRTRNSESALRVLQNTESEPNKANSPKRNKQNGESPEHLKVLHSPKAADHTVVSTSTSPNNQNPSAASLNKSSSPSTRRLAMAEPNDQKNAAVQKSELAEARIPQEREIVRLNNFSYELEVLDLPKGEIIENGEVVGRMPLPFDYTAPKATIGLRDMANRAPNYKVLEGASGPYISPLQEKRPWTYSLNLYPNFAFREFKIDPTKRALLHSDFIDAMQHSESSGVNLNVGFEVSRRIGPITYFNTGIEYINNSYNAEYDFVNFRDANFDSRGEIINYTLLDDPQRIIFNDLNSFHFLNFPASISYQPWATDHLRINLEFGFSMLYFLKAQGSTIDYRTLEQIDLKDRGYRKFIASSSLKIGVQYYLSPNMNIGFEPTLMYFTNSIYTEEYPFEVIPYSMGLNVNLQMKLQ